MSQEPEHVERLRRRFEAWDPKGEIEAWKEGEIHANWRLIAAVFDPEVSYEDNLLPDHVGETYHGLEGVVRAADQWLEPYEKVSIELIRIVGTGERVVSIHRMTMTAQHTGIEFESDVAYVFTFRDGKVIHFVGYFDPARALEAAGLSE